MPSAPSMRSSRRSGASSCMRIPSRGGGRRNGHEFQPIGLRYASHDERDLGQSTLDADDAGRHRTTDRRSVVPTCFRPCKTLPGRSDPDRLTAYDGGAAGTMTTSVPFAIGPPQILCVSQGGRRDRRRRVKPHRFVDHHVLHRAKRDGTPSKGSLSPLFSPSRCHSQS